MTRIQQVLFEVAAPYAGLPYGVSGHALFNALARHINDQARGSLQVSHGVFVPAEYGAFPEQHFQDGYAGVLGSSLPAVEAYDDLFLYRDAAHRWLLDSRLRDAHNAHDLQQHGDRVAFALRCWFGRPEDMRDSKRSVQWFLHCYVHADKPGVVPLDETVFDGVRVGAARNYGFGELSVADTQLVELDDLDYSRLEAAAPGECRVELVSPFVLDTEFPGADGQDVPWWWDVGVGSTGELRRRETCLIDGDEAFYVSVVDHGQVVGYAESDVVGTAKGGVTRVGTHSKFGFGELRVRPPGDDRVPGRGGIVDPTGGDS